MFVEGKKQIEYRFYLSIHFECVFGTSSMIYEMVIHLKLIEKISSGERRVTNWCGSCFN